MLVNSTVALLWLGCAAGVHAQQPAPAPTTLAPVPRLVWFTGVYRPATGLPLAPVETVAVAVYRDREGGDPMWQETQIVAIDADGRYRLLLGSASPDGLPVDLFTAPEPRWIGITVQRPGEAEQPRVHLASVPYALKASDAETLGGKPASAYLLADPSSSTTDASGQSATSARSAKDAVTNTAGTAGFLGRFVDSTNLGNSALFQNGNGVGVGTTVPLDAMHAAINDGTGQITGFAVQNLSGAAGAYSGMLFYDQNGLLGQFQGFNNATHEYRINNIAPSGKINFMIGSSTKFLVANTGNIGIGVAVPASKLDVAGDVNMTGTVRLAGNTVLQIPGGVTTNLGVGVSAFGANTNTGAFNTAIGSSALKANTSGQVNTGVGANALTLNGTGNNNTAVGWSALGTNMVGSSNTAVGTAALASNTVNSDNTAIGSSSLFLTTGFNNTAVGSGALQQSDGSGNIGIGQAAGFNLTGGDSNIDIGSQGVFGDHRIIRIGTPAVQTKFFAAGVFGITTGTATGIPVVIDTNGQLGTVSSSRRFKEDIHDMGDVSRGLLRLRPVTFRYRKAFDDGTKPIQYGLIAEEVAEVYPDLVVRSADGQIETVKYQVLDTLLLNEVQRQKAEIQDLQKRLAILEAALARRR